MTKSNKLVFFGNERLATSATTTAPTLRALIAAGYHIMAVVSHYEPGRSRKARALEIEQVANEYDIPLLLPDRPADISQQLKDFAADAAVLVAYGKIVPQSVIDIFPAGIINIHPSLLPQYRGPTPIEQVMLDSPPKTGVSLMQLSKEMDAGPVYAQTTLPLAGNETKQQLADTLLQQGSQMVIQHLPAILDGTLHPVAQDDSKATFCALLTKNSGIIDTNKTAEQLEREVRAYAGWPKSTLNTYNNDVIVTKASVVSHRTQNALIIECAEESLLQIDELIGPSGKTMSGEAFLRGYAN